MRAAVSVPLMALASTACAQAQPNEGAAVDAPPNEMALLVAEHEQLLNYLQTPAYLGPTRFRGVVTMGFETSTVDVCDNAEGPCRRHRDVSGMDETCWLVLAPAAARDIAGRLADGVFIIELTGQIATRPGMFGHLGQYTCQVEALRVHSLRETDVVEPGVRDGPELLRGNRTGGRSREP
jgi:hypothetical protein